MKNVSAKELAKQIGAEMIANLRHNVGEQKKRKAGEIMAKSEDSAALPPPQLSKHTPGPWRLSSLQPYYIISGDDPEPIVALADFSDMGEVEFVFSPKRSAANAKLIISAPELLAELERAHDMIRHYLKCGYLPHMSAEEAEQLVRNPDSAIRKAKGETL